MRSPRPVNAGVQRRRREGDAMVRGVRFLVDDSGPQNSRSDRPEEPSTVVGRLLRPRPRRRAGLRTPRAAGNGQEARARSPAAAWLSTLDLTLQRREAEARQPAAATAGAGLRAAPRSEALCSGHAGSSSRDRDMAQRGRRGTGNTVRPTGRGEGEAAVAEPRASVDRTRGVARVPPLSFGVMRPERASELR